jgi:serine/arginine repetitive matrix protein 1
MKKVNMDVMQPWIAQKVFEILGFEDEVVPEFIFELLEPQVSH